MKYSAPQFKEKRSDKTSYKHENPRKTKKTRVLEKFGKYRELKDHKIRHCVLTRKKG